MSEDLIGQFIGPYQIIEFLGNDGTIEVYLGNHPELDRDVLIYIAGRTQSQNPVFLTRFRQEAKRISRLRHPNIPRTYDFGTIQGGHYMVSDILDGVTLTSLLDEMRAGEREFSPDDITFIIRQIAAALDQAHSQGTIHQEVTPSHIILTRSGQAFLSGFGLAILRAWDGLRISMPAEYIAPEQLQDALSASPASDVYSLGIITYELVTGQRPFEPGSDIDDILRTISDTAPDPRYLNEDLPPIVSKVILKALSRMPRDRFLNAMHLATALEWAYANPEAVEIPQPKPKPRQPDNAAGQSPDQVIVKRRPTKREENREKRRLEAELNRIKQQELEKQRRLERARRQVEIQENRARRRVQRRHFFSQWGRTIVTMIVGLALFAAAAYLLQETGIIDINLNLPTPEVAQTREPDVLVVTNTPTTTVMPTDTQTAPPTLTPTPLQAAESTPREAAPTTQTSMGSSAYRVLDGAVMQFIPAGRFQMGTNRRDRNQADKPRHEVMLVDYWIDRYEITNAQYQICVDDGICQPPTDTTYYDRPDYQNFPVFYVTYDQAATYCLWIARNTDTAIGLPTEAQWEKAAGWDPVEETQRLYPWGNEPTSANRLQYLLSGASQPASPVGSHPNGQSAYGVHDMAGNVWEWVADWFDVDYYRQSGVALNPTGPLNGISRVTRGGSWTRDGGLAVTNFRNPVRPATSSNEIGFRCALNASQPPRSSRIVLSPLDVNTILIEQVGAEQAALITDNAAIERTFSTWQESLAKIEEALESGNNQLALSEVEVQLNGIDEREAEAFSHQLLLQLQQGLLWIAESITPTPTPTPTPSMTPTP